MTTRKMINAMRRRIQPPPRRFTGLCVIAEHTGDHRYVGRCDHATYDDVCPRHGRLMDYPNNDDRDLDPRDRRFD